MKLSFPYLYSKYNMHITGVIHAGGHVGQEAPLYNSIPTLKNAILFEPDKNNFKKMEEAAKPFPKIKCINAALGARSYIGIMYTETDNNGASNSLLEPKVHLQQYPHISFPKKTKVSVKEIDGYDLDESYNCLVMDAQGFELEILKGATTTLKNIDYIFTEVNREEVYKDCALIQDLDEFLAKFGFVRKEIEWDTENGMTTWGDALYIKEKKLKRIAFTIVLNGVHHLKHNDYAEYILKNFDYWVVIEGASKNQGSTSWCNNMSNEYQNNGASVDGTREYLIELSSKNDNLILVLADKMWEGKDQQVNKAAEEINKLADEAFVWEIDVDEQWTIENIKKAEEILTQNKAKTGAFLCNYFVGPNLFARGQWGEGKALPYRRLWHWKKDMFKSHEPPCLVNGNGLGILIPVRFNHYAVYFEKDVKFKNMWYGGHEGIYDRWKLLQNETSFPQHISKLLGTNTHWGNTDTWIHKI